jgi:hypothetical protein
MARISYSLSLSDDGHVIVKVTKKAPDHVYVPGKTRAQLTKDVLFFLRVSEVPINKDRLQGELDEMIWQHVPKRDWY